MYNYQVEAHHQKQTTKGEFQQSVRELEIITGAVAIKGALSIPRA